MAEAIDSSDIAVQLGEQLITAILHNVSTGDIKSLVELGAPIWYQNEAEGTSPLHAAAYTRDLGLVQYLIEKGAVWNAVDYSQNTAGDIALSYNDIEIYNAIRNAGIRAELLLGILSSRGDVESGSSTNLVLRETDGTAAGSSEDFLSSRLRYTKDETGQSICFIDVDGEEIGVMMGWETPIMTETVQSIYDSLPERDNLRVLNVGFGLGIIDRLFQALPNPPSQHVIIEPHPDVLRYMKDNGWDQKPGVKIFEGKWQDFVEGEELLALGGFDVVYTDTFSENYQDLHKFFDHLPNLLSGPNARFSFFNGLGATNPLFYDVYTYIAEHHLSDIGLDVQWSEVDVRPKKYGERWGKSREYFTVPIYRLPIAYLSGLPR
ncbi:arginine methyl transferase [Macrolepiota fuliginosa MF-IS2]|uniref:Arginine methyl transferase n=1 Tax=Macrolepiota fuliginosa MF-IS2 TaxID=1400762 RepID=A0A9P6C630_9AGAR|nr:arginine methyl transferase [Macrolepiota fuliginosa MF-IS2]